LDSASVSLFSIEQDVTVLDFQFPPINAWNVFRYTVQASANPIQASAELSARFNESFLESCIVLWPLIAACSITTAPGGGHFFPQYIVPQMLLRWVRSEQKVDGIRYFSTRTPKGGYPYFNCAFPARNIRHEGRCSYLREKFKMTDPIAWSVLREIDPGGPPDSGPSNWKTFIPVSPNIRIIHNRTGFYMAEQTLKWIEASFPDASKLVEP
jgi:hypothetical protein